MASRPMNMDASRKRKLKASLLSEQGSKCFWCRQRMLPHEATFDHLFPRSRGGGNERANLVLAHRPCNEGRGNTVWPFGKTPPILDQEVLG